MQRLTDERGAVSTIVALLMVPLIGCAAIAIDVAGLWAERQQLQTGADAGALAIAQDCARGSCGTPAQTAQNLVTANHHGGAAQASVTLSSGRVHVLTTTTSQHLFAPVLGHDSTGVSASASVTWGAPTGGAAVLPLAFSWCEFAAQTGGGLPSGTTTRTIKFTKSSGTTCTGPSSNVIPGGFGWIDPGAGGCTSTATIGQTLWSSTGVAIPGGCTTADFVKVQNRTVLLPVFDKAGDSGSNAWYHLYGYAAFTVTGYYFVGQYSWNASPTCSGNDRCIKGYFTRFVDLSEAFEYGVGAPQLGASVVSLTD